MKLEQIVQEGLTKKQLRPVTGLNPREAQIMTDLVAKAIIAELANEWKFQRDEIPDEPEELMSEGIMQMVDTILSTNYDILHMTVVNAIRKFR